MEFEIIVDKITHGAYDRPERLKPYRDNHVFDENESIKWNREEVVRKNREIKAKNKTSLIDQFKEDVIAYILSDYKINNNKEIAETIYYMAWENGHSYGFHNVLQEAIELAEFAEKILTASKK